MTQCEIDDEGESEEEFDEDSIETNDFGSGLSSSEEDTNAVDTYSANINRIKEKDENTLAEQEVHALYYSLLLFPVSNSMIIDWNIDILRDMAGFSLKDASPVYVCSIERRRLVSFLEDSRALLNVGSFTT